MLLVIAAIALLFIEVRSEASVAVSEDESLFVRRYTQRGLGIGALRLGEPLYYDTRSFFDADGQPFEVEDLELPPGLALGLDHPRIRAAGTL